MEEDNRIDEEAIMYESQIQKFKEIAQLKNRTYQVSLHVFDLIGLSNLRPSESIWSKFTEEKLSESEESTLFKILIDYCLSSVLEKYTRGIEILIADVESYLFSGLRLTPSNEYNQLELPEIYKYVTALMGRINTITYDLINNLTHVERIPQDYGNLDIYLKTTNGVYVVNDITIDIKDGVLFGTLEIFLATRISKW